MVATLKDTIVNALLKLFASDSPMRKRLNDPGPIILGAGIQPGSTALEIGCGRGFFTIPLAETLGPSGTLYAMDVTEAAVDVVTRKVRVAGLSNTRVFKANALDTGLEEGAVDSALLFGVIPSPTLPLGRLLPEMHRVLKPAGRLAVWTAIPGWSPEVIVQSKLFVYRGKKNNVHSFQRG